MSRLSDEWKRTKRRIRREAKRFLGSEVALFTPVGLFAGAYQIDENLARARRRRREEANIRLSRLVEATENERFVVRRAFRQARGAQRAGFAAAGVDVDSVSAGEVQEQTLEDQVREERLLVRSLQQGVQDIRSQERAAQRAQRLANTQLGIQAGSSALSFLTGFIPTGPAPAVGRISNAQIAARSQVGPIVSNAVRSIL